MEPKQKDPLHGKRLDAILEELGENETIQSNKYDRAIKLMDSGDYDSAYELLSQIGKMT